MEEQQKIEFSPNKSYVWKPTDEFPLKGGELHALKQILAAIISTEAAQHAIAAYEALKIVDGIIKAGVETGKITEAPKGEVPAMNE
jgi:hypothetical protein